MKVPIALFCILIGFITSIILLAHYKIGQESLEMSTVGRILTDNKTGCEYIVNPGITPRMDNTGKQICKVQDK